MWQLCELRGELQNLTVRENETLTLFSFWYASLQWLLGTSFFGLFFWKLNGEEGTLNGNFFIPPGTKNLYLFVFSPELNETFLETAPTPTPNPRDLKPTWLKYPFLIGALG